MGFFTYKQVPTRSCRAVRSIRAHRASTSMGLRCSQAAAAAVLLIVAVVGILLLVLPAKEIEMPPENMVNKRIIPRIISQLTDASKSFLDK